MGRRVDSNEPYGGARACLCFDRSRANQPIQPMVQRGLRIQDSYLCKDGRVNPDRQPRGLERQMRPCRFWPATQLEIQPADIRARYDSLFPTRPNPEASLSWAPVVPTFTGTEGLGGTWRHLSMSPARELAGC